MYDYYRGSSDTVDIATLVATVRQKGTAAHVKEALDLLHGGSDRTVLTEEDLQSMLADAFYRRRNLSQGLTNLESITTALGGFITGALVICCIILLNIIFSVGPFADLAISVSSAILGLSFIFASTAQQTFSSFIFLFVRHPYDVGDMILLPGYQDEMSVLNMEVSLLAGRIREKEAVGRNIICSCSALVFAPKLSAHAIRVCSQLIYTALWCLVPYGLVCLSLPYS